VEKFQYFGVVFKSDGKQNKENDTRIGKATAVLRELYRSVVTKWELSNTAKPQVFNSVFVPILTNGHECWVMTERVLCQKPNASCRDARIFAKNSRCDTLWESAHSYEIRKSVNVQSLL